MTPLLSKSTFIRSLQCQKSLYLYKNFYQLRDEISQERQYVFERGHDVGRLAQQLFPGGIDVGWESPKEYVTSVNRTNQCISEGISVIYEASFVWNNVLVAADILVKEGSGWHIYEVKSSLGISETYLRDAALQLYIAIKSGLEINGVSLIHLNRSYIRKEELELEQLFQIEDVTSRAEERMNEIVFGLIDARTTLSQNSIPDIKIGPHCDDPYTCDFKGYCGWNKIDSNTEPGELSIDVEAIRNHLSKIISHAAFIDLQVFRPAVPLTLGAHPYSQIPFGYALKTIDDQHSNIYVADAGFDFEEELLKQFLSDSNDHQTLICFDKQWQLNALKRITERFPQYKDEIEKRIESVIDLSDIFKNRYFYHPKMKENLRDLPAVFGLEMQQNKDDKIKSDSLAGTAFEHLYKDGDLMHAIEIKLMLKTYMLGNLEALELIYQGLIDIRNS